MNGSRYKFKLEVEADEFVSDVSTVRSVPVASGQLNGLTHR
jgi:hypothetical protein